MWRLSFRIFRAVSAAQYWMERRFTRAGALVAGGAVVAGALGVDTSLTVAYQIFTLLLAVLLVAMAATSLMNQRYSVTRELPRVVTAGQSFNYTVRVVNRSGQALDGLAILEGMADPRPGFAEFRAQPGLPTYRGWKRLIERKQVVHVAERALPPLASRAGVEVTVAAEAYRRGIAHFEAITVARADPLGIFRALAVASEPANLLVLPRRYELPPFHLPGSRRHQPGGVTLATSVGDSEEFLGLRDYRPGDPLQRIHWKSFARAGKPVVMEHQDEFFERHALVLDTFCDTGGEAAFEEAVSVAASFVYTIDTLECLLDLVFVGAEPYCYTTGRGQLQTTNLLEILTGVQPRAGMPFRVLHDAVLAQRAMLTGCICILLAWDPARRAFVQQLRALGVPLRAMVVTSGAIADKPEWLLVLKPGKVQEGLAKL